MGGKSEAEVKDLRKEEVSSMLHYDTLKQFLVEQIHADTIIVEDEKPHKLRQKKDKPLQWSAPSLQSSKIEEPVAAFAAGDAELQNAPATRKQDKDESTKSAAEPMYCVATLEKAISILTKESAAELPQQQQPQACKSHSTGNIVVLEDMTEKAESELEVLRKEKERTR